MLNRPRALRRLFLSPARKAPLRLIVFLFVLVELFVTDPFRQPVVLNHRPTIHPDQCLEYILSQGPQGRGLLTPCQRWNSSNLVSRTIAKKCSYPAQYSASNCRRIFGSLRNMSPVRKIEPKDRLMAYDHGRPVRLFEEFWMSWDRTLSEARAPKSRAFQHTLP